jgi:hypothetical protein
MRVRAALAAEQSAPRFLRTICRDTATWAVWKVTECPWLTTLVPILISFSRRLVSDRGSTILGIAGVRGESNANLMTHWPLLGFPSATRIVRIFSAQLDEASVIGRLSFWPMAEYL